MEQQKKLMLYLCRIQDFRDKSYDEPSCDPFKVGTKPELIMIKTEPFEEFFNFYNEESFDEASTNVKLEMNEFDLLSYAFEPEENQRASTSRR